MTATTDTSYRELESSGPGASAVRNMHGGFLNLPESSFPTLPTGACVCVQSVSYSKLQAGDYILLSGDGQVTVRRFIKLCTAAGNTRLVVASADDRIETVAFPRLLGLISRVKTDGEPINPNPQTFLHRAAFKLRYTFAGT